MFYSGPKTVIMRVVAIEHALSKLPNNGEIKQTYLDWCVLEDAQQSPPLTLKLPWYQLELNAREVGCQVEVCFNNCGAIVGPICRCF